jgi:hypothetical protein
MEQVSSLASVPWLCEAGWIGAERPHLKENRREEP